MPTTTRINAPDAAHGLTSLRFFAALYVVFYHALEPLVASTTRHPAVLRAVSLGYVSVSFFFFLSGYILSIAYLKSNRNLGERKPFYIARFARIYPIFLLTLLLDTPDWFVSHARALGGYLHAIPTTAAVFTEHLVMLQAWFPAQRGIDRPNWSLSVEIFFYLLFPFLAVRIWHLSSRAITLFAITLWIAGQFLLVLAGHVLSVDALMFVPIFHLSTFLLGIALARWQFLNTQRIDTWSPTLISTLPIAALALTIPLLLHPDLIPKQFLNDGLLTPIFAVIILTVSLNHRPPARLLAHPALEQLGHASYALYLFHFPILHLVQRLHPPRVWPVFLLYLGVCIAASLVSFRFIELPLRSRIIARLTPRR